MKRELAIFSLVLAVFSTAVIRANAQQLAVSHTSTPVVKQQAANVATGRPVARVNGTILTDRDLLREEYTIFPYAAQHHGQIPSEMEPQIRAGALKMIEFEELLYQDALRKQVTISPAKMQKAEAEFRAQFDSPDEYRQFLLQECQGSEKKLHEKIRRSLLIDAMMKAEVQDKSVVSVAEARDYYAKNPARFEYPESFAIQTISFLPPSQPTSDNLKELRKRAEEGLKQAKATTNYEEFGMLAEKTSEDDYRVMMGDHHRVDRTKLAPQVVQALLSLKPGEITGLIQMGQAYTIVRLNQHVLPGKMKFEDVRPMLLKQLQQRKTEEVRVALDRRLRKNAKVEEL
jgi:peptidyl-prolyl cis-trans isomerase SurA